MSPSRGSSPPRDQTRLLCLPALAGVFFTTSASWEAPQKTLFQLDHHNTQTSPTEGLPLSSKCLLLEGPC